MPIANPRVETPTTMYPSILNTFMQICCTFQSPNATMTEKISTGTVLRATIGNEYPAAMPPANNPAGTDMMPIIMPNA